MNQQVQVPLGTAQATNSLKPEAKCCPPSLEQTESSRAPPTPFQDSYYSTVFNRDSSDVAFHISQVFMKDVFKFSQLAEPATTEEMLPRHMRRSAFFIGIDSNLLETELK
jgi:hypothetical protein